MADNHDTRCLPLKLPSLIENCVLLMSLESRKLEGGLKKRGPLLLFQVEVAWHPQLQRRPCQLPASVCAFHAAAAESRRVPGVNRLPLTTQNG